ncbi:hypothetical protein [Plantactinospora endophytica]|uniref:Magnesium transporter MgtE intracellular domain-containing protein n=1 Tax=Plantactinospora endophytica TaxID=673535 RepID=A0ABQ4DU56_9ACTN|nr:hypothetical protein [Plantactinospora endophytica]GIG85993.1 hypothetical protein Pen02_09290 [Plantactinospora endophytica]
MTEPTDPDPTPQHRVEHSTIIGIGDGITAASINKIDLNSQSRLSVDDHRRLLETDDPGHAYTVFRKESDGDIRRLLLRSIAPELATSFLVAMAESDGPGECANHLKPMGTAHALPLLRSLDGPLRASVLARMDAGNAARLLAALARSDGGAREAAGVVERVAAATPADGTLAGPADAARILPRDNPGVLDELRFGPATASVLCELPDVGSVLAPMEPERAARHLWNMAKIRMSVVRRLLGQETLAPSVRQWLDAMPPGHLARLLARTSRSHRATLLAGMAAERVALLMTATGNWTWLGEISGGTAVEVLHALAATDPARAARCVEQLRPAVAGDLLRRAQWQPESRDAILRQLSPWHGITLLAAIHPDDPELAHRLLQTRPEWLTLIGTWPWWAATRAAFAISAASQPGTESSQPGTRPSQPGSGSSHPGTGSNPGPEPRSGPASAPTPGSGSARLSPDDGGSTAGRSTATGSTAGGSTAGGSTAAGSTAAESTSDWLWTWWSTRRAVAAWTADSRPRRQRDTWCALGGALLATLLTLFLTAGTEPAASRPAAAPSTGGEPTTGGEPSPVAPTDNPGTPTPEVPVGLPLLAHRSYWSDAECPTWTMQTVLKADSPDRPALLRLVCQPLQNEPATEVTYLQYPPGVLPYNNRPTARYPVPVNEPGATVHRVRTPGEGAEAPTWSREDGRHGRYIEYLPGRNRSAIWLEEQGDPPMAMILFGPDPAGRSDPELDALFAALREVLTEHGYVLDR